MYDLGGSALFLSSRDLQIGRGEPVQDTARVLSRYLDGIMIRTFAQKEVEDLATYGSIPIINGLTDYCHPCQVLADLMTIREHKGGFTGNKLCYIGDGNNMTNSLIVGGINGLTDYCHPCQVLADLLTVKEYKGKLEGLKLTYIGDGNNMTNSLIVGGIKMGMEVSVACPKGYEPDAELMKWAKENGKFTCTDDVLEAAKGADVLYTDVWASMGQEGEAEEHKKIFKGYQINAKVMEVANDKAMVLHCLPAHREEEITNEVFEAHANEIFDEAENRLHAQKAVLVKCFTE